MNYRVDVSSDVDLFGQLSSAEEPLFRSLNLCGTSAVLDFVFVALTVLGASYVVVWAVPVAWFRKRKEAAFDLAVVLLIASAVVELLKYATQRERPFAVLDDVHTISAYGLAGGTGYAFPSGHAARAFAIATSFSFISKRPVAVTLFSAAVLVGVSRIYLGLHWPSDVAGGVVVGVGTALLVHLAGLRWGSYVRAREFFIGKLSRSSRRSMTPDSDRPILLPKCNQESSERPDASLQGKLVAKVYSGEPCDVQQLSLDSPILLLRGFRTLGGSSAQPRRRQVCR